MTEDDFLAWREHPVTQWFMAGLIEVAAMNEELVRGAAWNAAKAGQAQAVDHEGQNALAIKSDAYRQIATAQFHHIANFHEGDDEHERD